MTAIMPIDEPRPRGTVIGKQVTGPRLSEAEHFWKCSLCDGYVDMRDLAWVEDHEGPSPWKTLGHNPILRNCKVASSSRLMTRH